MRMRPWRRHKPRISPPRRMETPAPTRPPRMARKTIRRLRTPPCHHRRPRIRTCSCQRSRRLAPRQWRFNHLDRVNSASPRRDRPRARLTSPLRRLPPSPSPRCSSLSRRRLPLLRRWESPLRVHRQALACPLSSRIMRRPSRRPRRSRGTSLSRLRRYSSPPIPPPPGDSSRLALPPSRIRSRPPFNRAVLGLKARPPPRLPHPSQQDPHRTSHS